MHHTRTMFALSSLLAVPAILAAPPAPSVKITSPKHKATVSAPLLVTFATKNIALVPASGTSEPGKAHLHLFIDADLSPADSVIPKTPQILHLGKGTDTVTVAELAPGPHRLIAVLGDGAHVPIKGAHTDTVTITVK